MIIVDTPFHVTFRSLSDIPVFACTGKCKKVYWADDIEDEAGQCKQCGGNIDSAVPDVHFKVLSKGNRNLKISDFKKYGEIKHSEKKKIQAYLAIDTKIMHLSHVKPRFEERAIKEWMPNGLNVEVSTGFGKE